MKYTQPTFTLPVSQGVSQEEWDRIFGKQDPEQRSPKGTGKKRRSALNGAPDKDQK